MLLLILRRRAVVIVALLVCLLCAGRPQARSRGEMTLYRDGLVWTGSGFESRDLAVRDGRFIEPGSATVGAHIVDLRGRYVVPAYANAHVHQTPATEEASERALGSGVFYAWNPNTVVTSETTKAFFARPDTYDVAVAQGGITEPRGHPEWLYLNVVGPRAHPDWTLEDFLGNAFHYGRTHNEIDVALDELVSQRADFVKAYLLFSEDYESRRGMNPYLGRSPANAGSGINPANARYLVEAAARRGFKAAFHVETAADLVTAAESGAAMAAHLPGYWMGDLAEDSPRRSLTVDEACRIAATSMLLVPTYSFAAVNTPAGEDGVSALTRGVQARNLWLLANAGGTLLTGTDHSIAIFAEAEHLASLDVLTPVEVLNIVLGTGAHLFPERRIGCFERDCEADFLVLSENPLGDIGALRSIDMRIKAGRSMARP
ncbi:hypothetical protein [Sphingosinicella sp. CPCC 101087]|uniref:amidohydrolase family protein n=1 Tax=Sphingosinicella sp. CPCC 101087 TaxID=2497754 RepID=UPI00101DE67E|nr:hypothetical protein [Sphingosinicella sp. CPCC 101087]